MKKLKLNIDDLKVESFETNVKSLSAEKKAVGKMSPVYGYEIIMPPPILLTPVVPCPTADTCISCFDSCGGTCVSCTCYNSCGCTDPAQGTECNTWFPSNICDTDPCA